MNAPGAAQVHEAIETDARLSSLAANAYALAVRRTGAGLTIAHAASFVRTHVPGREAGADLAKVRDVANSIGRER